MISLQERLLAVMARSHVNLSFDQLIFHLPEISPREVEKALNQLMQDGLVIILMQRYMLTVKGIKYGRQHEKS